MLTAAACVLILVGAASVPPESYVRPVARKGQVLLDSTAVAQQVFGSSTLITNLIVRSHDTVSLGIVWRSDSVRPFSVDSTKFFLLDGAGQQLQQLTLEMIKYAIQQNLAANWRGGDYSLPPPPRPPSYRITENSTGRYTVDARVSGAQASVNASENTKSTYTVTPETDYARLGQTLGLVIQRASDNRANAKLLKQAQETTAGWESEYFNGQSPILKGETRGGIIAYTAGTRKPVPPYTAVLFVTNPETQKEEQFSFVFGDGAEALRAKLDAQAPVPVAAPTATAIGNAEVLDLLRAGLSPDVVVAKIRQSKTSFDTSPTALKALKEAKVPDAVILAMIEAK